MNFYSYLPQNSQWKCHKKFYMYFSLIPTSEQPLEMSQKILNVFLNHMCLEIATGNVTKYLKNSKCIFDSYLPQNSHWKCHKKL